MAIYAVNVAHKINIGAIQSEHNDKALQINLSVKKKKIDVFEKDTFQL